MPNAAPSLDMPAIGRVSTEELVAQVNVRGEWHRRTPDLASTACGVPYHAQFAPIRREELRGALCPVCFCPHEIQIAKRQDEKDNRG